MNTIETKVVFTAPYPVAYDNNIIVTDILYNIHLYINNTYRLVTREKNSMEVFNILQTKTYLFAYCVLIKMGS